MKKIIALLLILSSLFPLFAKLDVYFVDVGQGDAIVINADGHWAIIDGGDTGTSDKLYSYINKNLKVSNFELIVLTHPDKDHVGGLPGAIKGKVTKNTVVWCNASTTDRYFTSFKTTVENFGSKLSSPYPEDVVNLGSAQITLVGPLLDMENENDNSLVVRLDYKGKSFLFTGDISKSSETRLTTRYATANDFGNGFDSVMLHANVLKIAHHGSKYSTSIKFLECVNPDIAIVSVGGTENAKKENKYGHPSDETLSKLIQAEIDIYRTDYNGTITISVTDTGLLSVSTEKNNSKPWFNENLLSSWQKKERGLL